MEDKFLLSDSILTRTSLCSYFVSWIIYLFTGKKNRLYEQHRNDYFIPHIFVIAAWWNQFLQCMHLMEKMQNLFSWSQCFGKFFSTKSKLEDTIYMGIICMSFFSRNLFFKNIYTMSFMWSNEFFSIPKWWLYLYCIFMI